MFDVYTTATESHNIHLAVLLPSTQTTCPITKEKFN